MDKTAIPVVILAEQPGHSAAFLVARRDHKVWVGALVAMKLVVMPVEKHRRWVVGSDHNVCCGDHKAVVEVGS